MEISADDIHDFVFQLLTTSKNADSLTMRTIMDEFKKKYGLDSVNKDLKSQVRANVDKVFVQINQQEDNGNDIEKTPVKANTQKSTKTENKRKREESESSEEMSDESCDEKKKNKRKKDNKRPKIENSDESDGSDFVNESKISQHENSSGRKSVKKQKEMKPKGRNEVLNMLFKDDGDEKKSRNEDEARSTDESEDEVLLINDDKTWENEKKMKKNNSTKNTKDIKGSKGKQENSTDESDEEMSEEESKASSGKKMKKIKRKECSEASKNDGLSDDDNDDSLVALKSKLQKFEHSVETSVENRDEPKLSKREKEVENADDSNTGSSEDDFEKSSGKAQKRKQSNEMVKNDTDDDSDGNLMALKSKLKTFEDSVDTKNDKQNYSDSDSDERSLKKPKNSGDSSSGRKKKKHSSKKRTDDDSDSSDDEGVIIEKKKRGSNSSGKEDQKSSRKDDSSKLKGLKRYLWKCGMRLMYIKFFDECRTMKAKERKLENHIKEITGIEGRITLKKCKKYKLKKERAEELAALDVSKIIGTPAKGKRVTRQSSSSSVSKKGFTPSPAGKGVFNNLRDLVDSEESESEKRARKTKKVIVLDSGEDSGEDGSEGNVAEEKKYSGNISDSSDVENEEQLSSKKSSSSDKAISSDEWDDGNMDVNGNKQIKHDSERKDKDSCEEASNDSE